MIARFFCRRRFSANLDDPARPVGAVQKGEGVVHLRRDPDGDQAGDEDALRAGVFPELVAEPEGEQRVLRLSLLDLAQGAHLSHPGQPVDQGGIAFIPEGEDTGEKRFRATGEIKDGQYDLDGHHGPNAGKYRVQITWHKKTGKQVAGERGHKRDQTQQVIPAKYNTQSELSVEIQPGRNTRDFDLKK